MLSTLCQLCLSRLSTLNQVEYNRGHFGENHQMFSIRAFKLTFTMCMINFKSANIGFPQYYTFY